MERDVTDSVPVVEARSLSKRYARDLRRAQRSGITDIWNEVIPSSGEDLELRESEFWAVRDLSFEIRPGEALGIVGRNGAGKSTVLRMLAGISKPTVGDVAIRGTVGVLLDPNAGFNPLLTGRENVDVTFTLLAGDRPNASLVRSILDYAGLDDVLDYPIRTYSQGMRLRLGFSVMVHVDPDVLIIDEALAVGDTAFQLQCLEQLHAFCKAGGALVFASHSLWLFQHLASQGIHLSMGRAVRSGTPAEVTDHYIVELQKESWGDGGSGPDLLEREVAAADDAGDLPDQEEAELAEAAVVGGNERPVRFATVLAVGADGSAPVTGSTVRFTFRLASSEAIDEAELALTIWTADLAVCLVGDVSTANLAPGETGTFSVPVGESSIDYVVNEFPLSPGRYAVRAALFEARTSDVLALHGYEDTPSWLAIAAPPVGASSGSEDGGYARSSRLAPLRSIDAVWGDAPVGVRP